MQVKKTKDDGKINRINFVNPCPTRLRTWIFWFSSWTEISRTKG